MSPEVAAFLLQMLNRQILGAGDDDFAEVARLVVASRRELEAAIAA